MTGSRRCCALFFLMALSLTCSARELWVDKESRGGPCSDSLVATAVSKATPLCSLGAAAALVEPGDLVHVRGGLYSEPHDCSRCDGRAVLQLLKPGTPFQWIRFSAEPGEAVILQGSPAASIGVLVIANDDITPSFNMLRGFQIRGFSLDCVRYEAVPDIALLNLDVSRCNRQAFGLHGAERVTLRGSNVHQNRTTGWTSAIDLHECKGENVIAGNWIWGNSDNSPGHPDSEGHGIIADSCTGPENVIENNLIFGNRGYCIIVFNSTGTRIRNNVCYHNGIRPTNSGEIYVFGNDVAIYNNILVPTPGQLALSIAWGETLDFVADPATVVENNDLIDVPPQAQAVGWDGQVGTVDDYRARNGRGWGTVTLVGDPRFVDPFGFDFHLQPSSPAIDAGNTIRGALIDFSYRLRPVGRATDMGAYEFRGPPQ